jgi:hypothetical protein
LRPYQKFELLPYRLFVSQVVVLFHQSVEERLAICPPHLLDLHRTEFLQTTVEGSSVDGHRRRSLAPSQRVMRHEPHRRQFDLPGTVQRQQQATAHHIAQRAVGLLPLPGFAQLLRQPAAARPRMCRDQFPDIQDLFRSDHPAPVLQFPSFHCSMNVFFLERKGVGMFLGRFI